MRIRFENTVEEIDSIDVVKAYNGETGECDLISIWMKRSADETGDYVGCYDLETITEAEADEEANALIEKLLVNGWCEAEDFGHFEWY